MWIIIKTTFRDGVYLFTEGERRFVETDDGVRFIQNGWAESEDGSVVMDAVPAAESTDLTIDSGSIGVKTPNLGVEK